MRILTSYWSPESDDTKIKFSDYFLDLDSIEKLDVLKDMICMLENKYDEELKHFHKVVGLMLGHKNEKN